MNNYDILRGIDMKLLLLLSITDENLLGSLFKYDCLSLLLLYFSDSNSEEVVLKGYFLF